MTPARLLSILLMFVVLLPGCASTPYNYANHRLAIDKPLYPKMEQQFYQGAPSGFLDASDWIWPGSLLGKLILWDADVDSHQISEKTVAILTTFLEENELENVQVLINTYKPGNQWSRLFKNKAVGAGWRYTLGILSVAFYSALPGRFFGGDSYNPYTHTLNIYSDDPSIVLHEGGHAKDFSRRENKGLHAGLYSIPLLGPPYYEAVATSYALSYLKDKEDYEAWAEAYEILYPAYGTYASGNIIPFPYSAFLSIAGVIPGHIAGQTQAASTRKLGKKEKQKKAAATEPKATAKP